MYTQSCGVWGLEAMKDIFPNLKLILCFGFYLVDVSFMSSINTDAGWNSVGRYLREPGMPFLTLQEEGLTKGTSCPSHCTMSGAS